MMPWLFFYGEYIWKNLKLFNQQLVILRKRGLIAPKDGRPKRFLEQENYYKELIKVENTSYGIKNTYKIKLVGKNDKEITANVVCIFQKNSGKTKYRIITVYPGGGSK